MEKPESQGFQTDFGLHQSEGTCKDAQHLNATEEKILCIQPEDEHKLVSMLTQNTD